MTAKTEHATMHVDSGEPYASSVSEKCIVIHVSLHSFHCLSLECMCTAQVVIDCVCVCVCDFVVCIAFCVMQTWPMMRKHNFSILTMLITVMIKCHAKLRPGCSASSFLLVPSICFRCMCPLQLIVFCVLHGFACCLLCPKINTRNSTK